MLTTAVIPTSRGGIRARDADLGALGRHVPLEGYRRDYGAATVRPLTAIARLDQVCGEPLAI